MEQTSHRSVKPSSFAGHIGVSRADITPPVDIYSRNWGAASHDVATGVHQPLTLTCITFQTMPDDRPLVMLAADLGGWKNPADEQIIRTALLKAFEIDSSRLMFCLSHTHSGPDLSREDAAKPGGQLIDRYLNDLQKAAIDATQNALHAAIPAVLTWQYGKCALATNRDLQDMERFVVGFNPEKNADDTLLVGRITDRQSHIIATIVNYACHPTTLAWDNKLLSPDYVGAMRGLVESATGAPCAFLQGASGELSPAEQYSGNVKLAEKNGRQLGYAVMSTLESMLAPCRELSFDKIVESGAALAVWKPAPFEPSAQLAAKLVEVPFRLKPLPSLAEIEKQYEECTDRVMQERLLRKRGVRKAVGDGDIARTPLWIWQLGDSFLIGQPNEAYSAFQQQLRARFSPNAVAVIGLVNGGIGYLPPSELYEQNIYQAWQTPFSAGSLEQLITSAVEEMGKL